MSQEFQTWECSFLTPRLGSGGSSVVYAVGHNRAVKVISDRYLDSLIADPERLDDHELRTNMSVQQLRAEHEMATALRDAGVNAVRTNGLYSVTVRWPTETGFRAAQRIGLVMDRVPGVTVASIPREMRQQATQLTMFELRKARDAGYWLLGGDHLASNAIYNRHTDTVTLVDFALWVDRTERSRIIQNRAVALTRQSEF